MFAKARRRSRRAFFLSAPLGCVFGVLAYGQGQAPVDCGQLPESRQPLCWTVLSCAAIEDEDRRRECFLSALDEAEEQADVASELLDVVGPRSSVPVSPLSPAPAGAVRAEPGAAAMEVSTTETATAPAAGPDDEAEPAAPPPPAPNRPTVAKETVERTVLSIPKRFSAEVTAVRSLIHNRQLIVLDNQLLFESDRARESRLEVGDQVEVVRASSFFGRRYRISGPARGAVTATRLRCELIELGAATRRKCALIEGIEEIDRGN